MRKEIYNEDKYKSQIQKYALCCDDFNDGVYRKPREKATLKKYIGYNNKYFINGFVFDVDHEYGAIAWDMAGLPKPNAIIQNTINGHAHLLYALKIPVLKTNSSKIKPLRLASVVQCGFTERLKADKSYADILMKNPLNIFEWRTTWTDIKAYDLYYLADFVPDVIRKNDSKKRNIYGLGRNVNLFEDLRVIAYKNILKYQESKNEHEFYNYLYLTADIINKQSNSNNPLSHNEIRQICQSVCNWTWKNFSKKQFSIIQSKRGMNNVGKIKNTDTKEKLEKALRILL